MFWLPGKIIIKNFRENQFHEKKVIFSVKPIPREKQQHFFRVIEIVY